MTTSMTAFSRVEIDLDGDQLIWEIRSVNHRYLDVNLRLPDELRYLDTPCRKKISDKLNRGRIDAQLKLEKSKALTQSDGIDQQAIESLVALLQQIEQAHPGIQPARSTDVLRWPGVMKDNQIDSDTLEKAGLELLDSGLSELVENRQREGLRMGEIISEKADQCRVIADTIGKSIPEIQQKTQAKWQKRIEEYAENLDPERVAQETAVLLTRSDVNEELDRLQTHLDEVARLISSKKPAGRSLDFLMQELNREANTLGSKSIDEKMTNASIELKVLIDQMREQVQNIE